MPLRANDLRPPAGAKRSRKRVGRGDGSGRGSYSGRGLKGQKSRSGGGTRPGFEGGQMSLIRKMPTKRGFHPRFRIEYTPINLSQLSDRFEAGTAVDAESLAAAGLLKRTDEPFKVLAGGEIGHALTITAPRVSASARTKIEAAGGTIDAKDPTPRAERRAAFAAASAAASGGDAEAEAEDAADGDAATDSDADED
jgi:large subunit ribosomal protein L15